MLRFIVSVMPSRLRKSRTMAALLIVAFAGLFAVARPPGALAIVGGTAVPAGSFQYVANVRVYQGTVCTGSLIDPRFVLTADHCVHSASASAYDVVVGTNLRNSGGTVRGVKRIFVDPYYAANSQGAGGHNDLALIQLDSPITNVAPVRLADPSQRALWDGVDASAGPGSFLPPAPDQGMAVGWGTYDNVNFVNQLQDRLMSPLKQGPDRIGIPMITGGAGICQGDSGGPLLISNGGQYVQAGVVKGSACGVSSDWTIVGEGANRDWILSVLAAEDPLLAAVPVGACANDTLRALDINYGDKERLAVQCLINQVRLKAGLNKLSFCALSGTYCENNIPGASLNFAQMKGFNIAAQHRATDVKNCTSYGLFYGNPASYGACNRPPEWWPRDYGGALCLGLTSSQCQIWSAPGWLPTVYEAQAYGVQTDGADGNGGSSPREAVDQILKSIARDAILKPGLNFSGVGVSIGQSSGLFMPYSKTGNVYDVFIS
jgi:Trypsin